jgi:septal ring factor EnvC (AmiA/AmiB activator)
MTTETSDELAHLRAENDMLRSRVEDAERALAEFAREALDRRAEVRALADELPAAMSRRAVVSGLVRDLVHHPDKPGVARRALAKIGRAPHKLARILRRAT